MSVSILEVIEAGGYDLSTEEDARWLLAQRNQWDELVDAAEELINKIEEAETERLEAEYKERYGDE